MKIQYFFAGITGQKNPYCIALIFANTFTINSATTAKKRRLMMTPIIELYLLVCLRHSFPPI
jgi:hypothetical protein